MAVLLCLTAFNNARAFTLIGPYEFLQTYLGLLGGQDSLKNVPAAIDAEGKLALAGSSTHDRGNQGINIVVRHFDSKLKLEWQKSWNFQGASNDLATDLVIDTDGNVYVLGYSNPQGGDLSRLIVLKYRGTDGTLLWQYTYGVSSGSPNRVYGTRLAVDASKNVYISGYEAAVNSPYHFSMMTNPQSIGAIHPDLDMLLLKVNSNGTGAWVKRWQPAGGQSLPTDVSIAPDGSVYLTGTLKDATYSSDIVVYKYNAAGTQLWMRHYGHAGSELDYAVRTMADGAGDLYIAGLTRTGTDRDLLAIKYTAGGTLDWALTYEAPNTAANDWANSVVVKNGYAYISGTSNEDVVAMKIQATDGTPQWTQRWNGGKGAAGTADSLNSLDRPYGLVVNDSGTVFVGGYSARTANDTTKFFMVQYDRKGETVASSQYNSEAQLFGIIPAFIFKGMTQDTRGHMYMLAAHRNQTNGLYEWNILKYGDVSQILSQNKSTVRTVESRIARAMVCLMQNPSMRAAIADQILNHSPAELDYAQYYSTLMDAIPGFTTAIRSCYLATGASVAQADSLQLLMRGYVIDDLAMLPTLRIPQLDSSYFYMGCGNPRVPERVAHVTTYRGAPTFPYYTASGQPRTESLAPTPATENKQEQVPTWYVEPKPNAGARVVQSQPRNAGEIPVVVTVLGVYPPISLSGNERFWAKCAPSTNSTIRNCIGSRDPNCRIQVVECVPGGTVQLVVSNRCGRTGLFNDDCSKSAVHIRSDDGGPGNSYEWVD
ncbi:MAG: hypothetical protein ACK51A_12675 [Sphingobacteriia bacterium]